DAGDPGRGRPRPRRLARPVHGARAGQPERDAVPHHAALPEPQPVEPAPRALHRARQRDGAVHRPHRQEPPRRSMNFVWDGIQQAADLLVHGDHDIFVVVGTTLRVALWSTLFALALGLPLGLLLGLGRFRGRRAGLAVANAGMGLPPVVVGLVAALLLFRGAPLGGLDLLYTLNGVILAQTLLALPLVAALTAAAVQSLPAGLLEQARAFGASRAQVAALALREARVGVLAATIAAMGSAFAEVGAVVLVGGNI